MECSYEDCDGHIGDILDWDELREVRKKYPKIPEEGKLYDLWTASK